MCRGSDVDDPIVDLIGNPQNRTFPLLRRQLVDLHGVARPPQNSTVGDDVAPHVEQPRPGVRRLDQPPHHLASEIGQQDLAFVGRIEHRALAERGGKDLALGLQRFDLLADEARLVFPEIEKPAGQKRQRQDIDRQDAPRKRRDRPAPPVLGRRSARSAAALACERARRRMLGYRRRRRRRGGWLSGRGIDTRRHRVFRSARTPYRRS